MSERKPPRNGRKAATVVVLGLLALGSLSACRTDAGTAVYVGDARISEAYVNSTVGSVDPARFASVKLPVPQARQLVAEYAAFNELAAQYAKSKGYATPAPDTSEVASIASVLDIPTNKIESNAFIRLIAQGDAWSNFLLSKTPARTATDADFRQAYRDLLQNGAVSPATSYESLKSALSQIADIGKASTLRNELDAEAKQLGVSVNPRYAGPCVEPLCDGLAFPLASISNGNANIPVVLVNMGGTAAPAVFDSPAPASTENAAAQ